MALVGVALLLWLAHIGGLRGVLGKGVGRAGAGRPAGLELAGRAAGRGAAAAGAGARHGGRRRLAALRRSACWQRLSAEGRPVFVDFTAAWCVSCQVNKRLVLNTDETRQAFERANVALMRADWTRRDAVITQALARLGRNGVPVYVLLRPGPGTAAAAGDPEPRVSCARPCPRCNPEEPTMPATSTPAAAWLVPPPWPRSVRAAAGLRADRQRRPDRAGLRTDRHPGQARSGCPTSRAGTWCWNGPTPAAPSSSSTTARRTCRRCRRRPRRRTWSG